MPLTAKSRAVLSLIAEGLSYSQIVESHPDVTYLDIFAAAKEALGLDSTGGNKAYRLAEIKERNPNAYEKWTPEEEDRLREFCSSGMSNTQIAEDLGRQPSAIRSRKEKLGIS